MQVMLKAITIVLIVLLCVHYIYCDNLRINELPIKNTEIPSSFDSYSIDGIVGVVSSSTGKNYYACTSTSCYKSTDYGSSWIVSLPSQKSTVILGVTATPKGDRVYVSGNNNNKLVVYKSNDFGSTYTKFTGASGSYEQYSSSGKIVTSETGQHVYVASGHPLSFSNDYGESFTYYNSIPYGSSHEPSPYYQDVTIIGDIAISRTGRYAYFVTDITFSFFRSSQYGKRIEFPNDNQFIAITCSESGKLVYGLQFHPNFSRVVLYKSNNYGYTFSSVTNTYYDTTNAYSLTTSKNGNIVYLSSYNIGGSFVISVSADGGKTFNSILSGQDSFQGFSTDHTGSHLLVGGSGSVYFSK